MACAAPTYFLHSSTLFGVLKSLCRRRHGPVGRINLAMILRENIPSELVFHILYAYIWQEARLSATHILFTLNWTQPTCSLCTSLQSSLGFSSCSSFSLTWPGCLLWVNFLTKIVTAAPRELEGMQENPGQESRWKSRHPQQHPLQIRSCLSNERWRNLLVITNFVRGMSLYQLVCSPNLLKISVAEWLQISKHWTTDWRVTHFPKGIEVSSLLSMCKMASRNLHHSMSDK